METEVYFVRHCESMANVTGIFSGWVDSDVSPKGMKQLEKLAKRFEEIKIDAIYSSPLIRAYKTAQAVNKSHNLHIEIHEGLKELNGGLFEGEIWAGIGKKYPELFDVWANMPWDFDIKNGESMRFVFNRVKNAVDEIVRENVGKSIAITSHGCALRNYFCFAKNLPIERLNDIPWVDNTSITKIVFNENFEPKVIFENDAEHINNDYETLSLHWNDDIVEVD